MPYRNNHLDAIVWKCEQLGISYGKLMQKASSRDLYLIYKEYEAAHSTKKKPEASKEEDRSC